MLRMLKAILKTWKNTIILIYNGTLSPSSAEEEFKQETEGLTYLVGGG